MKSQHEFLSFHRMIESKNINGDVSIERNDRFSLLLNDMDIENEEELKPHRRMQTLSNISGCVRNQTALEIAIMNAPDNSLIPTNINICKENIRIDARTPNNVTEYLGIHVINKYIRFRCIINVNKRCRIDARRKSRHFYVENSTLIFDRMTFMNGRNKDEMGGWLSLAGSLYLVSSNVVINNSTL